MPREALDEVERRAAFTRIVEHAWQLQEVEAMVGYSPLVEVLLVDAAA